MFQSANFYPTLVPSFCPTDGVKVCSRQSFLKLSYHICCQYVEGFLCDINLFSLVIVFLKMVIILNFELLPHLTLQLLLYWMFSNSTCFFLTSASCLSCRCWIGLLAGCKSVWLQRLSLLFLTGYMVGPAVRAQTRSFNRLNDALVKLKKTGELTNLIQLSFSAWLFFPSQGGGEKPYREMATKVRVSLQDDIECVHRSAGSLHGADIDTQGDQRG